MYMSCVEFLQKLPSLIYIIYLKHPSEEMSVRKTLFIALFLLLNS